MLIMDLTEKRVIKSAYCKSARGTFYKVYDNGMFYGWLKKDCYKEILQHRKEEIR